MSGTKTTTVDSDVLASLRRDSSQLRALRQDLPERIEAAVRQTEQSIANRLGPIEARQREYTQALQGLGADIRQVEQGMAQRIAEQAKQTRQAIQETATNMERQGRELRRELHDTAQRMEEANHDTEQRLKEQIHSTEERLVRLNEETRRQMRQQEQRLSNAITKERQEREQALKAANDRISQERREREQGLKAVNDRVDAIHQDKARLAEIARDQLQAAQVLRDFIAGHYPHEHFAPNQLNRLERTIASARKSLDLGASEAALAEANAAYQNLSDLRLELERLESEWRIWRDQALQSAGRLLAEAQANRKLSNVEETGDAAEANYWTGGKLADLEADIHTALNQAENEKNRLSITEMRKLVETSLPEMDCRLSGIVEEAQLAVIRSQMRTNIAELAMQALIDQGFSVQDGVYEGEDMRNGFVAKAKNRAGSEVVISVMPEGDTNRVTVDSFEPRPCAPGELILRGREIAQSMRAQGLQVPDPVTQSEAPSEVNRDLEEVRKRKTKSR